MNSVILGVLGVSALLTAISVVVPVARRLMLPYTLVLAGLGCLIGLLGYLNLKAVGLGGEIASGLEELGLLDDAFIYVFLPPLLFAAGLSVDVRHILEDVGYVVLLAFVAVLLCTFFVGYSLDLVSGAGLLPCLLLGAIVSTTDTAAVINIFREAGAPKRLSAIVEGEALFNDAAAIALFGLFLDMVTLGAHPDLLDAAREFLLALIGGAAFGFAMARLCGWLISLLQDSVTTEVTLTVALAYFTFIVSNEVLGISGVIATVTLAAFVGSGSRTRVSPGSWEVLHNVWEHLDFWATSFIFIISAMYIPRALTVFTRQDAINVGVVFVAAMASRGVVIGGMMPTFSAIGASKPLRRAYKAVLWWGGMRGAVTVALALAAAAASGVPPVARHLIVSTAIGYVIASLVLNGLTLRPLMKLMRLDKFNELDLALRNRMITLARRRVKKELDEVASAVGMDAEELSKVVAPQARARQHPLRGVGGLPLALETWCNHELDSVLSFRERGLVTRHNADLLRARADRLINALRNAHVEGYEAELERLARPGPPMRAAFWLQRRLGWTRPLRGAIASRVEFLAAELLLLRDLIAQCQESAAKLFGKDIAHQLEARLSARNKMADDELHAIEEAYPKLAGATHERYLTLVALGLVEAEYRRHLSEATISVDVFEDLDAQRRIVAARFTRKAELEARFDVASLIKRFPLASAFPMLKSCLRPYLLLPGQAIASLGQGRVFYVVYGRISAKNGVETLELGPGAFFSKEAVFASCRKADWARADTYANLVVASRAQLEALIELQPRIRTGLENEPQRRQRRQSRKEKRGGARAAAEDA